MTIRELLKTARQRLEAAGVPDATVDAAWLLGAVLHMKSLEVQVKGDKTLTAEQEAAFEALLLRRIAREPLQYILGETDFMGLRFLTRPPVLIPRNDTELLCQKALERLMPGDRVLDLCTGSGAIAISLALLAKDISVDASDISPEALKLARDNAALHKANVNFMEGDLFDPWQGQRYDMICCNPPYIPSKELAGLQAEVRCEPMLALDGGDDGLDFYRRLIKQASQHLKGQGYLLLEMGDGQGTQLASMLAFDFNEILIYDDMAGLPRLVIARWKEKHALT